MATVQELEELVVNMTGKADKYIKMLTDAMKKTETSGSNIDTTIEKTTEKVGKNLDKMGEKTKKTVTEFEKVGKSLKELGEGAQQLGETISNALGDFSISSVLKEYREAEKTQKLLTSAIVANGKAVEETMKIYKEYAEQLEATTTFSNDEILNLFRLAETYELSGDAAKRAVRNALALAEAHGVEADSALDAAAALEKGSTKALSKYVPSLKKLGDESDKVAEAQRLLGKMYAQVEAATNTSAGSVKRLNVQWSNFKQTVGETVDNVLSPALSVLNSVVGVFQSLPEPVKKVIGVLLTLTTVVAAGTVVAGTAMVAWTAISAAFVKLTASTMAATAASIALKVALIAGLIYAFTRLTDAIADATGSYDKFNDALKQGAKLNDRFAERFVKSTNDIIDSISKISDPGKKKSALEDALRGARNELRGYENAVKSSQKQVDELNGRWNRWTGNKILEASKKELEDHNEKLNNARSRVEQLTAAYNKLTLPKEKDKDLLEDVEKLVEELKLQNATLGMSARQVDIYKLSLRGASSEMLVAAEYQAKLNRTLTGFNELQKSAQESVNKLTKEVATFDMSPHKAEVLGIVLEVEKLEAKLKTLKPASEDFNRVLFQIQDTYKAIGQMNVLGEQLDEMKRLSELYKKGTEITKHNRSALEVYTDTVDELNELLQMSAIGLDTYNRALEDASKKFDEATKGADKYKSAISAIQQAEVGSAEAITRAQQFKDLLAGQFMEVNSRGDLSAKGMPDNGKKIDETNAILKKIEAKPATVLGVATIVQP